MGFIYSIKYLMQSKPQCWRGILNSHRRTESQYNPSLQNHSAQNYQSVQKHEKNCSVQKNKKYSPKINPGKSPKIFTSFRATNSLLASRVETQQLSNKQPQIDVGVPEQTVNIEFVQRLKTHAEQLLSPVKKSGRYKIIPRPSIKTTKNHKQQDLTTVYLSQLKNASDQIQQTARALKQELVQLREMVVSELKAQKDIIQQMLQSITISHLQQNDEDLCCIRSQVIHKALQQLNTRNFPSFSSQRSLGNKVSLWQGSEQVASQSRLNSSENYNKKETMQQSSKNIKNIQIRYSQICGSRSPRFSESVRDSNHSEVLARDYEDRIEFSRLFEAVGRLKSNLQEIKDMHQDQRGQEMSWSKSVEKLKQDNVYFCGLEQ